MKQVITDLMIMSLEAQVVHWKTNSFAVHLATEELYEGLREHTDNLVEALRGTVDVQEIIPEELTTSFNLGKDELVTNVEYHLGHFSKVETTPDIRNILDDICTLLSTIIYKLKYLS